MENIKIFFSIEHLLSFVPAIALFLLSPLIAGHLKKFKACLQNRKGASVIQPYWDIFKNFQKEEVISETTSSIFRIVPFVYFGSTLLAYFVIPIISERVPFSFTGDIIILVYLLALPRFLLALAGLDAGSAFGGMGSSREMMIASLAEPVLILSLFTAVLAAGTGDAPFVSLTIVQKKWLILNPGMALCLVALFLTTLAECGRLPVDNPTTHLELTMIHEAMILEYSGRSLALIEWASMAKLTLFLTLLANFLFPLKVPQEFSLLFITIGVLGFLFKMFLLTIVIALVETSTSKLRLFRVPDFLMTAFILALLGLLSQSIFRLGF